MWNTTDFSFKKFLNRRITSSIKKYYEEFGDVAIDIHATEVKYDVIPYDDPAQAVLDGVAEERNLFVLTLDNSVANNQAWHASIGPTRLTNWLSDKYGPNFTIKLYDNTNNQIYPTDGSDWIFDYVTGVLMFNGNANAFSQPFKITGYRYTGQFLSDVTLGGGGGHVIVFNNTPMIQRSKLNFLGAIFNLTDDALNDQTLVDTSALAAPIVNYVPTTPGDWSVMGLAPTQVQEALDNIAAFITLTAPEKAFVLTSQALTFGGQTLYTGKLPAGLPAAWYTSNPAGSTINNVIYAAAFTLDFADFRCGTANTPATYGSITAAINGVDINTYAMTAGPGSNGIIQALNFEVHNAIWEKADGRINANQIAEGHASYVMKHTEAGNSAPYVVHRDDNAIVPSFSSGLVITVNTPVNKWLSGVSYLGIGSTINVSFTIANAFRKVYMVSGVAVFDAPGAPSTDFDPVVTPNYTDSFVITNNVITLNVPDIATIAPSASVVARKPNNLSAATSNFNMTSICNGVSTYGNVATAAIEYFHDESLRLYHTGLTAFNSSAALPTEEAKVIPGALTYLVGGDVTQYYNRRFTKAAANNGNIIVGGVTLVTDVAPFGTGNLNILLKLETDNIWFDLGRAFGDDNGTGTGDSPANSKGARVSFVGGDFAFSFGTYSTALNGNQYLMEIVMKSGAPDLTSITTS